MVVPCSLLLFHSCFALKPLCYVSACCFFSHLESLTLLTLHCRSETGIFVFSCNPADIQTLQEVSILSPLLWLFLRCANPGLC